MIGTGFTDKEIRARWGWGRGYLAYDCLHTAEAIAQIVVAGVSWALVNIMAVSAAKHTT